MLLLGELVAAAGATCPSVGKFVSFCADVAAGPDELGVTSII